jgi:2-methylcitrate dehydratase PrpD
MTTIIDVELNDGRKLFARADFGKGSPANPMSYDEVADKFRGCCEYARVSKKTAEDIVVMVRDFESLPAISKLTALLLKAA